MKKRIVSLLLIVTLFLPSVIVPVNAVAALPSGVGGAAVNIITSSAFGSAVGIMIKETVSNLNVKEATVEHVLNILVGIVGYGQMPYWKLQRKCDFLNELAADPIGYSKLIYQEGISRGYWLPEESNIEVVDITNYLCAYKSDIIDWHVVPHPEYGWVIANDPENFIFSDALGRFPYANDKEDLWVPKSEVLSGSAVNHVGDRGLKSRLNSAPVFDAESAYIAKGKVASGLEYNFLYKESGGEEFIWCDYEGLPYGVPLFDTQAGNDREYNNDVPDQPLVSGDTTVDIDSNFIYQMFPDGSFTWVDNITFDSSYDASNKTYYIDASTSYDVDNNYYYSYEWHYTYHIDYTSITYIGQTAEYDEVYEYYYQLPDGRSSADLTAEELQALNTQIDVLPYIRSADDTSIRALYHFDGDNRDSSYWSHLGEFKWNKGASITYMDAGAFKGALYLDENEHDFTITLPSGLGTGDFTIQWRFYQSHTLTPVTDSLVELGGADLLQFDGASVKDASGNVLSAVSVGNWIELALMRKDGVLTYFLNGVPIGSASYVESFGKDLRFTFGDQQETYKYFDELRISNKALYSESGYTPTSVPHDTNLALVLPDSVIPVADEYWSITSSHENLLTAHGMDWWTEMSVAGNSNISVVDSVPKLRSASYWNGNYLMSGSKSRAFPKWSYMSAVTDISVDGGTSLTSKYYEDSYSSGLSSSNGPVALNLFDVPTSDDTVSLGYGLMTTFSRHADGTEKYLADGSYVFSIVTEDGQVGSLPFVLPKTVSNTATVSVDFNGYRIRIFKTNWSDNYAYGLAIQPLEYDTPTPKIIYMELCEGESTDLTAEFVSSVVAMDKDDLNTPSLAVRTDLNITGYQIGGVRPSLPTKGLVWALVEAGRITSLQIYNGQAWEEVDGRIWTGSRWVPYYAYDVLLLKDMYDIVESDPSLNPIYTETGFWKWLQGAWGEMMSKLDQIAAGSGGSGSGSGETKSFWNRIADAFTSGLTALIEGVFALITEILKTLLSLVTDLLSFLFNFVSETVLVGISDFFSAFTDGTLFEGFQQTDEDGNTTTQLPEGVGAVFADISGMISALPAELLGVLVVGIALLFLLGVIMLIV